jgi:lambda family phage portal protein
MGWFRSIFGPLFRARPQLPASTETIPVTALDSFRDVSWTGSKFPGGFGSTDFLITDYWTLRQRSAQLFKQVPYARGLIRRMIVNEINTGLHLECTPAEKVLGLAEDSLADWSEDIENRFQLWGGESWLCDHTEQLTWGGLQALARLEALVSGDVLVVLRQHQVTGLPRVQLISGAAVQTPYAQTQLRNGHRIVHGVELDAQDRQVAFWVLQKDRTSKRLPAFGEKSGRRIAWLVYGCEKRLDEVRGEPLLSIILQSLREIDRYRDSIQRKALILAMLAAFIKKAEDKPGTMPITGGAVRRSLETSTDIGGKQRQFKSADIMPGLVIEELQQGEEPVAFQSNGAYEKFGEFEAAILQAVAWSNNMPPEILQLSFRNNYSASQAAINEYKMALNMLRTAFGDSFCTPVYQEWLIASALTQKVKAPELVESWRDSKQYDVYAAWVACDWAGQIKPAVDLSKLVAGYAQMIAEGAITRDRMSRELTGTKFSHNVKKLKRENEQLAEAMRPVLALQSEMERKARPAPAGGGDVDNEDEEKEAAHVALG